MLNPEIYTYSKLGLNFCNSNSRYYYNCSDWVDDVNSCPYKKLKYFLKASLVFMHKNYTVLLVNVHLSIFTCDTDIFDVFILT